MELTELTNRDPRTQDYAYFHRPIWTIQIRKQAAKYQMKFTNKLRIS